MESALQFVRWVHILCGLAGLVAFWIPLFARKGGPLHRHSGQVFRWSAIAVLSAAAVALGLDMVKLIAAGRGPGEAPQSWAFLVFLSYLTLVTAVMLSHGIAVLSAKRDLRQINTPWRRLQAWSAIAASALVLAWALYWSPANAALLYALSPIGILFGSGILKTLRQVPDHPRQWLLEHLGALLGCGIAYHTAFSVFGASRLFAGQFDLQLSGWLALAPWVLPTLLGIPAIMLWSRYYRQHNLNGVRTAN